MKCFVISPIGDEGSPTRRHADGVFKYVIEPALKQFGIEAIRSDHMKDPGKISDQMYRAIFEYDLCIAVLTLQNPNVYYELAVAQSASRPVIVLIEEGGVLPFDLKDFRAIHYDLGIPAYEARTHINSLVDSLKSLEAAHWRGEDVFEPYRASESAPAMLDPTPFGVCITSPEAGLCPKSVRVEGTFKRLPAGYELRTLRYYPEQHAFVPNGKVVVENETKTWWVSKFDVGGGRGDARGIFAALAGSNASILLDTWLEAHTVHGRAVKALQDATKEQPVWLPTIKRWPTDLVVCARLLVTRE